MMRSLLVFAAGAHAWSGNVPSKEGNTYGSKADACDACYSTISKSCATYLGYTCSASNSAILDTAAQAKGFDAKTGTARQGGLGQSDTNDWYFGVNADLAGGSYIPCCNAATQDTSYKSNICTTYNPNGTPEEGEDAKSEHHWSYCQKKLGGYPTVEPAK